MRIAYLDEFGHIGPFISRYDKVHNASPVFGLSGLVIADCEARHLATFMLKLKEGMLKSDLQRSAMAAHSWEKKGAELLSTKVIKKYPHIREGVRRLLLEIRLRGGKVIYYGREKFQDPQDARPNGLYKTVLAHEIRRINEFCTSQNELFMMIMDQHSGRRSWMETASKTMFDKDDPARQMIEPPLEVESHLYQTIQIADWIATLLGRLLSYRALPSQYADWDWSETYFGDLVDQLSTHSMLWRPSTSQRRLTGI